MKEEYLTLKEAREYLGVSKPKMWRLVKEGALLVYSDPLDKRKKMVRKDALDKLRQPRSRVRD
jgi:excisionase family DNA binding protein